MQSNLDYYKIEKAIYYIEKNFKKQPKLEEVANYVGLSKFHFQRLFKEWAGISPKKFLQFLTVEHLKSRLVNADNILNETYDAGLTSTSRLYDHFTNIEAVTPQEYLSMGDKMVICYGFHPTKFGESLIAITDRGICALYFGEKDNKNTMLDRLVKDWSKAIIQQDQEATRVVILQIFNGEKTNTPKLFLKGTNFQIQVWKALLRIPEGKVTTYSDLAAMSGNSNATRAAGTAIGMNQISLLIPCHRVIKKSGLIGEYRWGNLRKKAILISEA